MKLKKTIIPILLLVAVFVTISIYPDKTTAVATTKKKSTSLDYVYWFSYIGPTDVFFFSDITNPNNYVILPGDQDISELCEGNDVVCAIASERIWNGYEWRPDFSNTSWGSAYWGLYNYYTSGYPSTSAVRLKDL